jgi:hypothetical protein
MTSERRKQLLLAGLLVVLAFLVYRAWLGPTPETARSSGGRADPRTASAQRREPGLDVRIEALSLERPKPAGAGRNLFRFARVAAPRVAQPEPIAKAPAPLPRAPEMPRPTIALKLIGIVDKSGQSERVAVLSDERGVYHGREGDIIEGRYQIVRVNAESVEISLIGGDVRQVVRLSGT